MHIIRLWSYWESLWFIGRKWVIAEFALGGQLLQTFGCMLVRSAASSLSRPDFSVRERRRSSLAISLREQRRLTFPGNCCYHFLSSFLILFAGQLCDAKISRWLSRGISRPSNLFASDNFPAEITLKIPSKTGNKNTQSNVSFLISVPYRIDAWLGTALRLRHSPEEGRLEPRLSHLHQGRGHALEGYHELLDELCDIGVRFHARRQHFSYKFHSADECITLAIHFWLNFHFFPKSCWMVLSTFSRFLPAIRTGPTASRRSRADTDRSHGRTTMKGGNISKSVRLKRSEKR